MLQSGIKASMAIRIYGDSLDGLAAATLDVAEHLKGLPQVIAGTVNPDIGTHYGEVVPLSILATMTRATDTFCGSRRLCRL